MRKQRTLREPHLYDTDYRTITPHIHFVFIGILYEEPQGMKATPSQQTSLTELWGKGARKKEEGKTKAQPTEMSSMKGGQIPAVTTPIDSKVMDVDVDARSSLSPESSRARKPRSTQAGGLCLRIL